MIITFEINGFKQTLIENKTLFELSLNVYSCFEKGCPTKPYATMPKDIMGNGGLWSLIEAFGGPTT